MQKAQHLAGTDPEAPARSGIPRRPAAAIVTGSLLPGNLLTDLAAASEAEDLRTLVERPGLRVERIVSQGQVTPPDRPFRQDRDEWVLLLAGAARILLEGQPERPLLPGDHLLIPAGLRHWVTFTDPARPTIWLAVHFA